MAHFGTGPTVRPAFSHTPPNTQAPRPAAERTNAYGAKCADCGVWVAPGVGRLTKANGGGWAVSHIPPCPEKVAAPVVETVTVDGVPSTLQPHHARVGGHWSSEPTPDSFSVPDGRYTVVFETGEYKTVRVSRQNKDADFMPGRVLLSYLSGSDNDTDYTRFGHVDEQGSVRIWKKHQGVASLSEAVKVLLGDPKAASKAYAAESGCCGVCGRTLTTPESLAAGIGPVCMEKVGW